MTLLKRRAASATAGLALTLALVVPGTAAAQSGGVPVAVAEAEMADIVDTVRLTGTVASPRVARVSTSVAGLVETVNVDLGDSVARGDPVVELDRALARQDLKQAEAATAEAQADLADARRRLDVAERLRQRDNIPRTEYDAREAQVQMAEAVVARRQAEQARAAERLRRHSIAAPFAGVVAEKVAEAGEWVAPGTTVVELVATQGLLVDFPVPQKYYPDLEAGTPITLGFDALPDRRFEARRVALVPVSDPTARTFTLRVRPVGDDIPLTPGMSARAELHLATGERGVVVSRDAIVRYPDGRTTVWVLEESDEGYTVAERQVLLGRAFEGRVHLRRGLEAGERVVVRGNEALRPGQPVRLTGDGGQGS